MDRPRLPPDTHGSDAAGPQPGRDFPVDPEHADPTPAMPESAEKARNSKPVTSGEEKPRKRNFLFRLVRILAFTVLGLLLLIGVIAATIYRFPQLVLNTTTARWALDRFAPEILSPPSPANFEFSVTSPAWSRFRVHFKADDFCAKVPGVVEQACFETLKLNLGADHHWLKSADLTVLGPMEIIAPKIVLNNSPEKEKKKEETPSSFDFGISRTLELLPVKIQIGEVRLSHTKPFPVIRDVNMGVETTGPDLANVSLEATALSSASERVTLDTDLKVAERRAVNGSAKITTRLGKMNSSGTLNLKVQANLQNGSSRISGNGTIAGPPPYLKETRVQDLVMERKASGALDVGSEFVTQFHLPGGALGRGINLPSKIKVEGSFNPKGAGKVATVLDGRFLEPSDTVLKADAKFSEGYKPETADVLATIEIHSMQRLVRFLAGTPYEVPAPIRVLEGPINLRADAHWDADPKETIRAYPITLSTRLQSPNQRLILDASGKFVQEANRPAKLIMKADLKDVKLQAPRLDPLAPIPLPITDSRIKNKEISREDFVQLDKESKNPSMLMELDINSGSPIEILHPMFEPSLQFRMQYRQVETGAQMQFNFVPTTIEFMGRKARLEELIFKSNTATETTDLVGRVSMRRSGYRVVAAFSQKADKTVVDLSSEPPLPQEDIISLLLFNEISSEIEPEDQKAVQDTRSAVSQRALGFFSLWVLASTPVESVHFDPTTGVYSAKVKLPGGISAEVGSDWDRARELELRKRLSRRWAITTGVRTDEQGEQAQESFIEWFYRY